MRLWRFYRCYFEANQIPLFGPHHDATAGMSVSRLATLPGQPIAPLLYRRSETLRLSERFD
jgi:hypothetical protein